MTMNWFTVTVKCLKMTVKMVLKKIHYHHEELYGHLGEGAFLLDLALHTSGQAGSGRKETSERHPQSHTRHTLSHCVKNTASDSSNEDDTSCDRLRSHKAAVVL